MSRSSKRIVCRVRVDDSAKVVEFTWSEGSASFKPYALNGEQVEDFRANVQAARDVLFAVVRQHERRVEDRDISEYERTCYELADSGHNLYNQLFDRAARDGEHVEEITTWLRDITRTGQVESLEIVCDGQPWFAPWNLVYDEQPDENAFRGAACLSAFAPFWGMRDNICGGQPVDPLRRMPLPTKPHVLIVIDPVVLDGLSAYADGDHLTQRDRLEAFLKSQALTPITSSTALAGLRQDRPHVIYWLGHAGPELCCTWDPRRSIRRPCATSCET